MDLLVRLDRVDAVHLDLKEGVGMGAGVREVTARDLAGRTGGEGMAEEEAEAVTGEMIARAE